jgi:hypothetical protein
VLTGIVQAEGSSLVPKGISCNVIFEDGDLALTTVITSIDPQKRLRASKFVVDDFAILTGSADVYRRTTAAAKRVALLTLAPANGDTTNVISSTGGVPVSATVTEIS